MPIRKKKRSSITLIFTDILVTVAALCVFALFHHVLPTAYTGENIQIARPASAATGVQAGETIQAETSADTAAAGEDSARNNETAPAVESAGVSGSSGASSEGEAAAEAASSQEAVGSFRQKFADKFTDTVVTSGNSYTSPNASITVTKEVTGSGNSTITYYVADIYIADITCFQTGFAKDTYGKGLRDTLSDMDDFYNALISVAGDYYGNHDDGVVIRNGVVYRSEVTQEDICVLYYDGTMETIAPEDFDLDEVVAKGAWQAWTFGPALLDGTGDIMTDFNASSYLKKNHPRTALGYYEPGHYCFVVIDGRDTGYSMGMNLSQMSELMASLGCTAAYNLDGGKSAVMVYNDEVVNQPDGGGRELSDCVLITEAMQ